MFSSGFAAFLSAAVLGTASLPIGGPSQSESPLEYSPRPNPTCLQNLLSVEAARNYPTGSDPDQKDANHRSRPEMRGPDGHIYPAADFVRADGGVWVNAVTGQSASSSADVSKLVETSRFAHLASRTCGVKMVPRADYSERGSFPNSSTVIAAINRVRMNPQLYADELVKGSHAEVVLEAAAYLRNRTPLPPLFLNKMLEQSAARHVADQGPTGSRSHVGTDGSTVRTRVEAAGLRAQIIGEEISFDTNSAEGIVRQLIVDAGVPDRGHRRTLFDVRIASGGAACGMHAKYNVICVIDIAGPAA